MHGHSYGEHGAHGVRLYITSHELLGHQILSNHLYALAIDLRAMIKQFYVCMEVVITGANLEKAVDAPLPPDAPVCLSSQLFDQARFCLAETAHPTVPRGLRIQLDYLLVVSEFDRFSLPGILYNINPNQDKSMVFIATPQLVYDSNHIFFLQPYKLEHQVS